MGIELKPRLLKPHSIEPYPNFAVYEYQSKLFPEENSDGKSIEEIQGDLEKTIANFRAHLMSVLVGG